MNHGKSHSVLTVAALLIVTCIHLSLSSVFCAHHLVKSSPNSASPLASEALPSAPLAHPLLLPPKASLESELADFRSQLLSLTQQKKTSSFAFKILINGYHTLLLESISLNTPSQREIEILSALTKKGLSSFDLSSLDQSGNTLLHSAIHHNHDLIIHYLIPLYAQENLLNLPSKSRETPFLLAVKNTNVACAQFLFDFGADIHLADSSGKTALQWAYEKKCIPLIRLLSHAETPLLSLSPEIEGLPFRPEISLADAEGEPGSLISPRAIHKEQIEGAPNDNPLWDQKHTKDAFEGAHVLPPPQTFSFTSAALTPTPPINHEKQPIPNDTKHTEEAASKIPDDSKHTTDAVENAHVLTPSPKFSPTSAALIPTPPINHEKQPLPDDKRHAENIALAPNDTKHTHDVLESARTLPPLPNSSRTTAAVVSHHPAGTGRQPIPNDEKHTEEKASKIPDDSKHTQDTLDQVSLTKVDVTVVDNEGYNALHIATKSGNDTLVRRLIPLFAKANLVNAQTHHGHTALTYAAAKCDEATVKALIGAGADITKTDDGGFNALHCAAENGKNLTAQYLIPLFAKASLINALTKAKGGGSALTLAAEKCNAATVKALLDAGADVKKTTNNEWNALHCAAGSGNNAIAQLLIPHLVKNYRIDSTTNDGESALTLACAKCDEKTLQALLNAGVEITYFYDGRNELRSITSNRNNVTVLHRAAENGKTSIVHYLIPHFANVGQLNAQAKNGNTALIDAAINGHDAVVKMLIQAGADITKTQNGGFNALHAAAEHGKNAPVQTLIPLFVKAGLLNAQTKNGDTALSWAAAKADVGMVKALLAAGADITKTNNDGFNALHRAAQNSKNDTVKLLLPLFAKAGLLNAQTKNGDSALTLATAHCDEATVKALLATGADITKTNNVGFNALHRAAQSGKNDTVQLLLPLFVKSGLINALTKNGDSALTLATAHCDEATVKTLLDANAEITKATNDGSNALHISAQYGKNAIAQHLIQLFGKSGLLNAQTKNGDSALTLAIAQCDEATIKAFLATGVDITKTNNNGFNALHRAAQNGKNNTAQLLLPLFVKAGLLNAQTKNGDTALSWAAAKADVGTVKALLAAGADITKTNNDRFNALHVAAQNGKNDTVQLLLPLFAKAGLLNDQNKNGDSALTLATAHCDEATVKALLATNADITKTNNNGLNVLHVAAQNGKNAIAQYLVQPFGKSGLLNAQTKNGESALILAAATCNEATVKTLLNAGADITKTNRDSFNALHCAAQNGKNSTAQLLIPLFAKAGLLNALTKQGGSALSWAVAKCNDMTIKTLIDAGTDDAVVKAFLGTGADITKKDNDERTALHHAALHGNNNTVQFLLPIFIKTYQLDSTEKDGYTAFMIAAQECNETTVQAFIDAGANLQRDKRTVLHSAAVNIKYAAFQPLLPHIIKAGLLNFQNKADFTALIVAAMYGNDAMIKALINAGADITKTTNHEATHGGSNALHCAAAEGKSSTVQLLAPYFAKAGLLNAQTKKTVWHEKYDETALILAAFYGHDATVKALIDAGADIAKTNNRGWHALQCAAAEGKNSTVQLLIPYFAKAGLLNAQAKKSLPALVLARDFDKKCDHATIQALIKAGASESSCILC